jgi:hypothetical protein
MNITTTNNVATKIVLKVRGFNKVAVASLDEAREAHGKMRSAYMAAKGQPIGDATLTVNGRTLRVSNNSNIWDEGGNLFHGVKFDGTKVICGSEV